MHESDVLPAAECGLGRKSRSVHPGSDRPSCRGKGMPPCKLVTKAYWICVGLSAYWSSVTADFLTFVRVMHIVR